MTVQQVFIDTPLGVLRIRGSDGRVDEVSFVGRCGTERGSQVLRGIGRELLAYFDAGRRSFSISPVPLGSAFRQSVLRAASDVSFGETRTYGQMAQTVGNAKAARAVGTALAHNRHAILIPCHRIVGVTHVGGYAWGEDRKRWLLNHENRIH